MHAICLFVSQTPLASLLNSTACSSNVESLLLLPLGGKLLANIGSKKLMSLTMDSLHSFWRDPRNKSGGRFTSDDYASPPTEKDIVNLKLPTKNRKEGSLRHKPLIACLLSLNLQSTAHPLTHKKPENFPLY
jgi:hypothetical protein